MLPLMQGHATVEGTTRYAERFPNAQATGHFRAVRDLVVSTLGIGTYLGAADDETDDRYVAAIELALQRGINVVDTAINYRFMRAERAVGRALRQQIAAGSLARDEVVVCTKGGYLPYDTTPPSDRKAFVRDTYEAPGLIGDGDLVDGCHCMAPAFLRDQVGRSLDNLGLSTVDVYYVHNPETQRPRMDQDAFEGRLRAAFEVLEAEVAQGRVRAYGVATWNGFRVPREHGESLDLTRIVEIATEVGGPDHHFRFVQAPINLLMREAASMPTQRVRGRRVPLLSCARTHGIHVVASGSLLQGRLARGLPGHVRQRLPGFDKDSLLALQFVRSLEVATALVGMSQVAHVEENLELLSYRSRRMGV